VSGPAADTHLHVDVHAGDGPPALLVHGFLAGRALWSANLDALRAVCTPVVVELWGHGRSPTPEDVAAYHPDTYVAAFDALRRRLGTDRWILVGHSLGAALTWRYALDHPDRVVAHVFTNTASALGGARWRHAVAASVDAQADALLAGGPGSVAHHRLNPARARRIVAPVREALAADVDRLDVRGVAATLRHTVPAASVREQADANVAPTLLVHGTREAGFAEAAAHAATLPHVEIVALDVGHSPNAEAPAAFDAIVVDFLGRVATR
jgi:pimeloyl-ACP methyl ester carboxylesterase